MEKEVDFDSERMEKATSEDIERIFRQIWGVWPPPVVPMSHVQEEES